MTSSDLPALYPLLFEPVLKDYIWGGRNLSRLLGRSLPADKEIAESWEISAHANGDVQVANGHLAGKSLSDLNRDFGLALVGSRGSWALDRRQFPLLIKLLDANRRLSVQVHPNDDYARDHENNELGKTEMWVVLHADADASIILGVKEHTTPASFRQAVEEGRLEHLLHEIPVRTGDFVCVPSGSLHAILDGLLIAEIQQSSDVTYRVYDWNRLGHDGKPRSLHVDKAMDVINFDQREPTLPSARPLPSDSNDVRRWELCRNKYFAVERVQIEAGATVHDICNGESLQIWGVVEGWVTIQGGGEELDLQSVRFTLLPARLGHYSITAAEGPVQLLHAFLQ